MSRRTAGVLLACIAGGLALTGSVLALVGDLNVDGMVDAADLDIIAAAYGSSNLTSPSPDWDWRADLNSDDHVDLEDLALAGRNYGDTFNVHWRRRISNGALGDVTRNRAYYHRVAVDSRNRRHVIWYEDSGRGLYYCQLDPSGNTLVEDRYLGDVRSDELDLALGPKDQVHIVWYGPDAGTWYMRLSADGRTVVPPRILLEHYTGLAVAADGSNHPHLMVSSGYAYHNVWYYTFDEMRRPLFDGVKLNTHGSRLGAAEVNTVAIDHGGTRHFLWQAEEGDEDVLFYTRILSTGVIALNQLTVTHLTDSWRLGGSVDDVPAMLVDSRGAAHVVWKAKDEYGDYWLFWRRVDGDGSLSEERRISLGAYTTGREVKAALGPQDELHVIVSHAEYREGLGYDEIYGRLDRDGNLLRPFHLLIPDYVDAYRTRISVDTAGDAIVSFRAPGGGSNAPLFVVSTVPDGTANDNARSDVVVDRAHTVIQPSVVRITDQATVTTTVWNAGWVTATDVTLRYNDTEGLVSLAPAVIPSLPPMSHSSVARTFDVPDLEGTSLFSLTVRATTPDSENLLTNNMATATMGIVPPATDADILSAVLDETHAPATPALATYVYQGELTLEASTLTATRVATATGVVGWLGVPLDMAGDSSHTAHLTLTYEGPGYAAVTKSLVAARDPADPYRVVVTPTGTVELFTNRWGAVRGRVVSGTVPLSSAEVRLSGGTTGGRETETDVGGFFTYTQVPSGTYQLEAILADHEPTSATVTVRTGEQAEPVLDMPPTTRGIVWGAVSNDLGRPYAGATVELWAGPSILDTAVTGGDGTYELEIPDAGAHSFYTIKATATAAQAYEDGIGGLTPGLPETYDFVLPWTETADTASATGRVVSWIQEESWNTLDLDGIPIGDLLGIVGEGLAGWFGVEAEGPSSYEVRVWWGEYFTDLGLNYAEIGADTHVIQNLSLGLYNGRFNWYLVTGDKYSLGGPYAMDADPPFLEYGGTRSNVRIDRVELVAMDGDEVTETTWRDDTTRYSGADGPTGATWQVAVGEAVEWSDAVLRIWVRVGQYDEDHWETANWRVWRPPVPVVSLSGAGSGMGADYQCITWDLSSGDMEVDYAWTSYPTLAARSTQVGMGDGVEPRAAGAQALAATPRVSVTLPGAGEVRVGEPCTVAVELGEADARPIHGVELDLEYNGYVSNPDRLFLLDIAPAPDLDGPAGAYQVPASFCGFNAESEITDTAAVRLGDHGGLTQGQLVRATFLPLSSGQDRLYLHGVHLVGPEGRSFRPSMEAYAYLPIADEGERTAVIDADAGGALTATVTLTTTVQIPPGVLTETTALVYRPLEEPGHPTPSGACFAGRAFWLGTYVCGSETSPETLPGVGSVRVWYDDQAPVDLIEKGLVLERWDDTANAWVDAACGPSTRDASANWIDVPISTLGQFALFELPPKVYLPLALRTG